MFSLVFCPLGYSYCVIYEIAGLVWSLTDDCFGRVCLYTTGFTRGCGM